MKIILHMGMGKTGTSSLQASLCAASGKLRDSGIYYPRFTRNSTSHHLLLALCGNPNQLPGFFLHNIGGPDSAVDQARSAWDTVCREVHRRRPDILVLSSEHFFLRMNGEAKANLVDRLSRLSDEIVPILYVRHPVPLFRANVQQRLKSSNLTVLPYDGRLKDAVLEAETIFSRPLELVAFDRNELHGGDISADFATRFLSPLVRVSDLPSLRSNVGLSAEALVLMARLREQGGNTDDIALRVSRLTPHLEKLDHDDPPARPFTLLPDVAEAALRAAVSHRWLVKTGRLQIPGLDVDRIDGAPLPDWMNTAPPDALFSYDPDRLDRLRRSIDTLCAAPDADGRPGGPLADSKPRIRDLVLRFLQRKLASLEDRNTGAAPTGENPVRRSSQGDRNADT